MGARRRNEGYQAFDELFSFHQGLMSSTFAVKAASVSTKGGTRPTPRS
jgi:hypothetical protein